MCQKCTTNNSINIGRLERFNTNQFEKIMRRFYDGQLCLTSQGISFRKEFIIFPVGRVVNDVIGNRLIRSFISDDVFIEIALP